MPQMPHQFIHLITVSFDHIRYNLPFTLDGVTQIS